MGATFSVTDGILETKDFLIDSTSMLVTGDGSIDLKKKEINGNMAISPLVTLDTFIDKIPIVRNILRTKDRGFLYAACTVTGPFDDPDISISFINSVGGKTLEILRNILVLPKEIFE